MSNQISKIIVFALSIFIATSCNTQSDTEIAKKVSIEKVGTGIYKTVYRMALDSLNSFSSNRLYDFKDITQTKWILDSLICFNSSRNKCIMSFHVSYGNEASNGLNYLYGISIRNKWYFIRGSHIFIQSEMYGFPPNTPLSFEKLHEIAMKQIYKGYLKPKGFLGLGGYEINDDFFRDIEVRDAYNYPFTTQESWEESWLRLMRENWAKKDTTVYRPDQ
jgi:hypothetical protein